MHRVRTFSMFLAACAALSNWSAAATAAERPVWELRPYRVRVLVGVAGRPEVAARLPAVLAGRLAERIPALQGGAWDVTASPAPAALQQAMTASLAGVTADVLPKDSLDADKIMLLQVSGCRRRMPGCGPRTGRCNGTLEHAGRAADRTALETPGSVAGGRAGGVRAAGARQRCEGRRGGVAIEGVGPQAARSGA